jgi:hypothetical protein
MLGTQSGRGRDRLLQLWQLLFAVRPKLPGYFVAVGPASRTLGEVSRG